MQLFGKGRKIEYQEHVQDERSPDDQTGHAENGHPAHVHGKLNFKTLTDTCLRFEYLSISVIIVYIYDSDNYVEIAVRICCRYSWFRLSFLGQL